MSKYEFVKLITSGGKHLLQMPDGQIIGGLVFTRVYDGCEHDDPPYVIAKIQVELLDQPLPIPEK